MSKKENKYFHRFLEMVPALITWNVILFLFWGSFLLPKVVAYFVIAFLIFWLYQSFRSAILGIIGFSKIKTALKTNWYKRYKEAKRKNKRLIDWEKIRHVVLIPNVAEPKETLIANINCLLKQKDIDPKQIFVVLAMEERDKNHKEQAKFLTKKYKGKFGDWLVTIHPHNRSGEIIGKASNEAWAARKAKQKYVDKMGHKIDHLIVTTCDADTCFGAKYFSALTYHFIANPERHLRFWQSPIFWHNNLNKVPAPIRIIGIIGNIIHVADLQELEKLTFNVSSYSLSFKLLDKTGYWDTDIIPEDWHIFLQAFFANKGKVLVEPIFVPTSSDAPEGKTYFGALKNRYKQCQRHAWGATDIPYAIEKAITHSEIPFLVRALRIYKLIKTHLIWATSWFVLTLGASLPPILNPKFFQTSFGYNLPKFSRLILTICLISLPVIVLLDWRLRSEDGRKISFFQKISYILQWILMPIASFFMAGLPGLHAQTRLFFGKRLEYFTTRKYQ